MQIRLTYVRNAAPRLALVLATSSVLNCGGSGDTASTPIPPVPAPSAVTGVYSNAGSLLKERSGHAAVLLRDGKVLVVGGVPAGGPLLPVAAASAEFFDPATNVFATTGSMTVARRDGHTATVLSDGRVLVCGGFDLVSDPPRSDAEIFDPRTGQFTPTGSMTQRRTRHAAVLLANGKVLVAGGIGSDGLSAELFDPVTGTFSSTPAMPHYRIDASAALLADGRVLLMGYQDAADIYDPTLSTFSAAGSAQTVGGLWFGPSLTMLTDGRVLAVAGQESTVGSNFASLVTNGRLFDPATNRFSLTGALVWPRALATSTRLPDGRVLVFGGEGSTAWPDRGELYDPSTGLFTPTVSAGAGRYGHTATLLQNGKVLIAGGLVGTSRTAAAPATGSLLFELR